MIIKFLYCENEWHSWNDTNGEYFPNQSAYQRKNSRPCDPSKKFCVSSVWMVSNSFDVIMSLRSNYNGGIDQDEGDDVDSMSDSSMAGSYGRNLRVIEGADVTVE